MKLIYVKLNINLHAEHKSHFGFFREPFVKLQ